MGDAQPWGRSKSITLVAVVTLHLAVIALVLDASRRVGMVAPAEHAIEVLLIPRARPPRVRARNVLPQPLSTDVAAALAPPAFISSVQPGTSSGPAGRGPAVNWTAEAHRALRAFEIRRDQAPGSALSVSSPLEEAWDRPHRAGDQSKTDSGDWIVWINAECYEIAGWHSGAGAFGDRPAGTICRPGSDSPRRN